MKLYLARIHGEVFSSIYGCGYACGYSFQSLIETSLQLRNCNTSAYKLMDCPLTKILVQVEDKLTFILLIPSTKRRCHIAICKFVKANHNEDCSEFSTSLRQEALARYKPYVEIQDKYHFRVCAID